MCNNNEKQVISTDMAPAAVGPYSQAVRAGGFVFLSGQIPIEPSTGKLIESNIREQALQVMKNLSAVILASGGTMENIVKVNIYLSDMDNFSVVNEVYGSFFKVPPARATVEVSRLPKNVDVEMDAIAYIPDA